MAAPTDPNAPCGGTDHSPRRPQNRAGLNQIDYRITTQPESLDRMTWRLPRQQVRDPATGQMLTPLEALRSRDLGDPTISLMDAYAMATDVLSFYSERVANEGYLGTATQRRSVLELARMIGYELAPGVAASTYLAFTVEAADDPYRSVEVGAGVQALSIPTRKDELPQVFETVEPITARAEWNDMRARTQRPQPLVLFRAASPEDGAEPEAGLFLFDLDGSFDVTALEDPDLVTITTEGQLAPYHPLSRWIDLPGALAKRIADHATNPDIAPVLHALPVDETYVTGLGLGLSPGHRVLAVGQAGDGAVSALPLRVVRASEDADFGLTRVVLTRGGAAPAKVRRAPAFHPAIMAVGAMPGFRTTLDTAALNTHVRGTAWSGDGMTALVQSQNWPRTRMMTLIRKALAPPTEDMAEDGVTLGLHVMDEASGFFGSTAQLWSTLDYGEGDKGPYKLRDWDGIDTSNTPNTIWMSATGAPRPAPAQVLLDREIDRIQPNSWAILENAEGGALGLRVTDAALQSHADYALTGKATALGFQTAAGDPVDPGKIGVDTIYNSFNFRSSRIHAASRPLPLAGVPLAPDLAGGVSAVDLDGLYLDLERDRPVALSGARLDALGITGRETHVIADVQHIDGLTRLLLRSATAYPYVRTSLRVNANVALATHGEAVIEELGSGDARLPFQRFTLKKPPLTHVSAASETGRATTLRIRVNGALWSEVPALAQAGPDDAVYQVRQDNDGTTHVQFGDGLTGRRLPTGALNVLAEYRSGIGQGGEVPEQAISQLKTRPLGVRAVINPSPATGAADPETLDAARHTAPGTVKTLGRIVSLTDYEDFAATFAGIGKAQARLLWSGSDKVVHLTIAPETDSDLEASDPVLVNLRAAVDRVRDLSGAVLIEPFRRRLFTITARLETDPVWQVEDVILWARQALETRFGYDARALAQSVSAAEVIAALHSAPGVVSADLDGLALLLDGSTGTGGDSDLQTVLPAWPATGPGQRGSLPGFTPADLLTVLPSAIVLSASEVPHA